MKSIIKYRLTATGEIPTFVYDGGYYSMQDDMYPFPRNTVYFGISIDDTTGDFELVTDPANMSPPLDPKAVTYLINCKNKYNAGVITPSPETSQTDTDTFISEIALVDAFLLTKNYVSDSTTYAATYYSATTQADIANLYASGKYFVKVDSTGIVEWYESGVTVNSTLFAFVSRNLLTDAVEDVYSQVNNELIKNPTDATPTKTVYGGYFSVPTDKIDLLDSFLYKTAIQRWSDKPYGFIVEYTK